MALIQPFDGPIPGENYTSDTKNYPWHRPPEFSDLDEAIEYSFKKLSKKNAAIGLITMLEMGLPISDAARTFVIAGIGDGRWTPDFAILLAGPVARIMIQMAKKYGIEYDLGIDDSLPPTKPFLEFMGRVDEGKVSDAVESVDIENIKDEATEKSGSTAPKKGFMTRLEQPDNTEMDAEGIS